LHQSAIEWIIDNYLTIICRSFFLFNYLTNIFSLFVDMQKTALPAKGSIFHQRCGGHILNLVVQDGLAVLSDEIVKVRNAMKYFRHSQARMERFQLTASQVFTYNL
jgi:hypothetical protein